MGLEVEGVAAVGYGEEVEARRGVQGPAPAVSAVLQSRGLDHLDDLPAAGDPQAPPWIELQNVDTVGLDHPLVGLRAPLVLSGADRRSDGGSEAGVAL